MKRKNNILFNIGLEGNPRSTMEILDGLKYIFGGVDHFAEVLGQWDGKPEKTLVALVPTGFKLSTIVLNIENLCLAMDQDAIATRIWEDNYQRNIDLLVYSPSYNGKRYNFDKNYFKLLPIN